MAAPTYPDTDADFIAGLTDEDFINGGHRTNFLPSLFAALALAVFGKDTATFLQGLAEQVADDAAAAAAGSGTEATVEALRAGTSAFYTSIRRAYAANAPVTLTDAASIAWDMSAGINFKLTLGAAGRAMANPSNQVPGKSGLLIIAQDATGGRTITNWGSHFVWIGDPPYWPVEPNRRALVSYFVEADGAILLNYGGSQ